MHRSQQVDTTPRNKQAMPQMNKYKLLCGLAGAAISVGVYIMWRNRDDDYIVSTREQALKYITIASNQVVMNITTRIKVKHVPEGVTHLYCNNNQLTSLPDLPSTLRHLDCTANCLTSLPKLPDGLIELHCAHNKLHTLPFLPNTLEVLDCGFNKLQHCPGVPLVLYKFRCGNNMLKELPTLPGCLRDLECDRNQLRYLPALPNSLRTLNCAANYLRILPDLPVSLLSVQCQMNCMEMLPAKPPGSNLFVVCNAGNPKLPVQMNDEDYTAYYNRIMRRMAENNIAIFKDELLCRVHLCREC